MAKGPKKQKWVEKTQKTTFASPQPKKLPEPTSAQLDRLSAAEMEVNTITAEHGAPTVEHSSEKASPTLEESLKRVEKLLCDARGHFDNAGERKAALDAREASLDEAELKLLTKLETCEARAAALSAKEAELQKTEVMLIQQAAHLTEREVNAEEGFRAEKSRILKPLEEEVARLRQERDRLDAELTQRLIRVEEEARAKAMEWADKWMQQDAERSRIEIEARRTFEDSLASDRQQRLAKLQEELKAERTRAEAEWQHELDARRAALDTRAAELDEQAQLLSAKTVAHYRAQQDLKADQEMLVEDRAALDRKVQRLVTEQTENLRHEADALRRQLEDARALRDGYFKEVESRRELDRRFNGRTPEEILGHLAALEKERDTLAQQLRERPDARAAERLAELERERSGWLEERAVLQGELAKATGELATRRLAAIELESLRKHKEALEVHKQLLDGAVDELRSKVDELTRQDDHRNPMTALSSLDEKDEFQAEVRTTTPLGRNTPTLRDFAEDLRHRIATGVDGRTLYYAERDVRAFLGGLAMTRLMLLQGISGTGKTSLPLAFASAVGGGIEVVEVQAGWRDRQDLVGYYNAFHRHYYATNFLQALYRAGTPAYRDRLFLMVLDEINLSRPEQFFADFLSALEQPMDARRLTLVNDPVSNAPRLMDQGRHLPIPPNVWFVGTANHDESTAEFADKTYDRAHVMEMPRKTDEAFFSVQGRGQRNPISYAALEEAFAEAGLRRKKEVATATDWLRNAKFVDNLEKRFRVGWGNRLEQQLARYLPVVVESGGTVGEAMDQLLVTKILRKLKDRHDVRITALEELYDQLLTSWDQLDKGQPPERCIALIEQEIAAKQGEELA